MFTGKIEEIGILRRIKKENGNVRLTVECSFSHELKIDQSVSHNGVCLTVVGKKNSCYEVVAIDETIQRSNIGLLNPGDLINLERCTKLGERLDGHIVQGHVDTIAKLKKIIFQKGSWLMYFEYKNSKYITVEKGSICVNGISLTVVDSGKKFFSAAIIPYTFENTNLKSLKVGGVVNVEFDIIGKYVQKLSSGSF